MWAPAGLRVWGRRFVLGSRREALECLSVWAVYVSCTNRYIYMARSYESVYLIIIKIESISGR